MSIGRDAEQLFGVAVKAGVLLGVVFLILIYVLPELAKWFEETAKDTAKGAAEGAADSVRKALSDLGAGVGSSISAGIDRVNTGLSDFVTNLNKTGGNVGASLALVQMGMSYETAQENAHLIRSAAGFEDFAPGYSARPFADPGFNGT